MASMQKWILTSIICGFSAFAMGNVDVSVQIEGVWKNIRHGIEITVLVTENGIKTQRANHERWYNYVEYREGQYRDENGHNYYIVDENTIEWEDRSGKKRLRFTRSATSPTGITATVQS